MTLTKRWLVALGAGLALTTASAPLASASTTAAASSTDRAAATASLNAGNAADARVGIDSSPVREALKRAINPGDYQCGPTRFDSYIDGLVAGLSQQELTFLIGHVAMLDIPTYDALFFGTETDARYALRSDYKAELTRTFRDLKRFWDVESSDIQLMSMHGSMLQDPVRVARVLQLPIPGFGFTPAAAQQAAQEIATATRNGWFSGGNSPLFTLNAFAFTAEGDPDPLVQGLPDKMIFGDGIVDALNALGIGDVGPRVVLAHEFGHHIQFEDGLFDSPLTGPEATRRTELMADAFGTYFAVHAKGLSLNRKRVMNAEQTFFEVGDCSFTNDGHHGTPLQRMRAAVWGASVADAARPQSYILPSRTFAAMFDQKLPELVAPDAA